MLGTRNVTAFVATTNPERAKAFYGDTLGLPLVSDDPWALVFSAAGTVLLRIQKVEHHTPHPFTALGWNVPDVAADVAALASRGVRFERYERMQQDDAGVWTSPSGAKVAWFKDPDGNVLSLTEDAAAPLGVNEQRQRLTPAQESANAKGFFAGEEREV
jgi:catechol 2,3-dioxygenase-like lactoylglutathione lyase family enzyme